MALVKEDLLERHICLDRRMTDQAARTKLDHILREEEEWQGMIMYSRDKRFSESESDMPLERTILDMLHCPMRIYEKVLNVLYGEIFNGKTKNEVNGVKRRAVSKVPLGASAEGVHVAKMFVVSKGQQEVFKGKVIRYSQENDLGLYTVLYIDGDREDMNYEEYRDAQSLFIALAADEQKSQQRVQDDIMKVQVAPVLEDLTTCIRELGSLGPTCFHQWDQNNGKKLQKIQLPLDQSKRIFNSKQLGGLYTAVDIAVSETMPDKRRAWKSFLAEYVASMDILTCSEDYTENTIATLVSHMETSYTTWIQDIAGIKGVTNYFHYYGSGHILWLIRRYGNLWRYRNEGVESLNGILSLRYNKFNNKGGHKNSSKGEEKVCSEFEVLGAWMERVSMWVLGLGDNVFRNKYVPKAEPKAILWKTGNRIVYAEDMQDKDIPEWLPECDEDETDSDDYSDYDMDCSDSEDDAYICGQGYCDINTCDTSSTNNDFVIRKSMRRREVDISDEDD
jgi:hypothetical protein